MAAILDFAAILSSWYCGVQLDFGLRLDPSKCSKLNCNVETLSFLNMIFYFYLCINGVNNNFSQFFETLCHYESDVHL